MRGAYEKEFKFGISIVISAYTGFLTVSTNQTTYHIKVRKVNETNSTATSTNSWSWADDGNRTFYTYGEGTGAESFLKNPSIYTVEKLYR